jgi:hypothetical protein
MTGLYLFVSTLQTQTVSFTKGVVDAVGLGEYGRNVLRYMVPHGSWSDLTEPRNVCGILYILSYGVIVLPRVT